MQKSVHPVDLDDVLGDHKLGDACDLVPEAGVAAWPATSLAAAKPDCNVRVAPRRSRWAVRLLWPQKSAREGSNCWRHPCMRDRKQRRLSASRKLATRGAAERAFVKLRDQSLLRDAFQAKPKVARGMFDIIVIGGQTQQPPEAAIAEVAFCTIERRSDVARAFRMHPRSATRCKTLAASCGLSSDEQICRAWAGSFSRVPPHVFATSKCCDWSVCHFHAWRSSSILHVRSGTSWFFNATIGAESKAHG